MKFEECLRKRLLRKEKPDLARAKRSMEIAKERLTDAEISFDSEIYSATIILGYTAMFYAARALLFKDGFSEKSHACVAAYLKEKYIESGKLEQKFIKILKEARFERHEVLYGLESVDSKEDAEYVINNAKEFIKVVSKLLI